MTPFQATHKRSRFRHVHIAHTQFTHFTTLSLFAVGGCVWSAYRILVNLTSGGSRPLGGISTNLFWSISTITVPLWRHCFLSWRVSSEHYCQAEVFCSWYMQIVEPLQSLQAWPTWLSWSSLMNTPSPSPLRWWWLSLIMTPTSILNGIILSMEPERNTIACCWGE